MVSNVKKIVIQLALAIKNNEFTSIKKDITLLDVHDLLDLFSLSSDKAKLLVFRLLDPEVAADLFAELAPQDQNDLLKHFTDKEIIHILEELEPDERTAVFEQIPGKATQRLFNLLPAKELIEAKQLLWYPEESVWRLMTPHYVAIKSDRTVEQALEKVRKRGADSETINVLYIVDEKRHMQWVVSIRDLVLAQPQDTVIDIMTQEAYILHPRDDREKAVSMMQKSWLTVLPVLDAHGVLLGIVTADDILDVASEEATEDFHKWAAVAPLKQDYQNTSIQELVVKRLPWLLVLVVINLASSWVIAAFEETLAAAIALAFFIPLLIDSGGNAGAQSATIMVRAIATGDVKMHQRRKTFSKEIFVWLVIGVMMWLASGLLWWFRGWREVSLVVTLSMVAIVVFANCVWVLLPFVLTKLKQDPAVASGPLITSLVDAWWLLIYFSLATWIIL